MLVGENGKRRKGGLKIQYDENPLKAKVLLNEQDLQLLRSGILVDALEEELYIITEGKQSKSYTQCLDDAYKEIERVLPYYLSALDGETHMGDCISVSCSCTKCQGESYLGISTLDSMREPYYINKAFNDNRITLEEAIKYLQDNPAKPTWEGSESYVESWQLRQDRAIEDLIEYKEKYFGAY